MRYAWMVAAFAAFGLAACGGGGSPSADGPSFGGFDPNHAVVVNPGGAPDVKFGSVVAWVDWNQDGLADVVVGSPGQAPGNQTNAGSVFLYVQSAGGVFSLSRTLVASDWAGGAVQTYAYFGDAVCVGDYDGDGRNDVAIGAPGDAVGEDLDAGRVYVWFNSADHLGSFVGPIVDPAGTQAGAGFGSVLAAGRIDGDTKSELAVGSPDRTEAVELLAGRITVLRGAVQASFGATFIGPVVEAVPASEAMFGSAIAIADMTADGLADLVVGVPGADSAVGGEVQVWKQVAGPAFSHQVTLETTEAGIIAGFGASVAAGDVNGDGRADIVAGCPYGDVDTQTESGFAIVLECVTPATGVYSESMVQDRVPEFGAQFGGTVAIADVTGDGIADLLVGAPAATQATLGAAGHVTLFRGLGGGAFATPTAGEVYGAETPETDAAFGVSIDLFDADGDGFLDVVVGAPGPLDDLFALPGSFEVLLSNS